MRALPSVSVCIPVYRGEQFLAETVRSVLDQTHRDFELVVLDNASPDTTGRIARSFDDSRVRVETNSTTVPQPENWRRAVRLCRTPLIKLLCADDLLHPRCLEYQVGPMEADPGLALVAGRRHMIDERSRVLVPRRGLPETLAAFRVARESLSAGNESAIYDHQKALIEELGASPHLQVRGSDLVVGRLRAPIARLRRRALYRMSRRAARRDDRLHRRVAAEQDVDRNRTRV